MGADGSGLLAMFEGSSLGAGWLFLLYLILAYAGVVRGTSLINKAEEVLETIRASKLMFLDIFCAFLAWGLLDGVWRLYNTSLIRHLFPPSLLTGKLTLIIEKFYILVSESNGWCLSRWNIDCKVFSGAFVILFCYINHYYGSWLCRSTDGTE